jgi:hypothetical protein
MNPIRHDPPVGRSCHNAVPESNQPRRLLSATETEHQVQSRLLLDVVVGERAAVFQLLSGEDETLLIRGNTLLVLDLRLHVVDRIRRLNFQRNCLSGKRLDEDLHTSTEAQDEMQGGLLLNVVVGERATVLKLLAGEDETLLVRRDALLVLDLALHVVDGIRRLNFQRNGLSSKRLDEDLHTTAQTEHEMERRLLLDVVVAQGAAILKLLAGEDQALLVWGNALLIWCLLAVSAQR